MIALPAHAGHWLVEALFVAPVVVITVWISAKALLARRRDARDVQESPPAGR